MKKSLFFILISFVLATFVSCKDPNNSKPVDTPSNTQEIEDPSITRAKLRYKSLIGKEFYDDHRFEQDCYFDTVAFTDNAIIIDNNSYDLVFISYKAFESLGFYENSENCIYLQTPLNSFAIQYHENNDDDIFDDDVDLNYLDYTITGRYRDTFYYKGAYNAGNNGTSIEDLTGTYSYNGANGSGQVNGNIILNDDGTWDSNSTKLTSAISNKNYTVNGNKITFNWTANGMSVSTEVTVTDNGSSLTFEANNVNLFSMLFGVVSTSITVTKQ